MRVEVVGVDVSVPPPGDSGAGGAGVETGPESGMKEDAARVESGLTFAGGIGAILGEEEGLERGEVGGGVVDGPEGVEVVAVDSGEGDLGEREETGPEGWIAGTGGDEGTVGVEREEEASHDAMPVEDVLCVAMVGKVDLVGEFPGEEVGTPGVAGDKVAEIALEE